MFTLVYAMSDARYTFETDSMDIILAMALEVFDQGGNLIEIWEGEKMLYHFAEIYELLHRCTY